MAKISVMGTGSWGTALAILLHNNGHQVMLWSAHPEKAASLNETREDPKKLPGIKIPEEIAITGDEKKALDLGSPRLTSSAWLGPESTQTSA